MSIIFAIFGLLLIFVFGYLACGFVLPRSDSMERLTLSFVVGIGLFSFIWFLVNLLGIPYTYFSGLVILILFVILLWVGFKVVYKKEDLNLKIRLRFFKGLNLIEKIILGLILFFLLSSLIADIYWPVRNWDSLALYDFRAKIFAETGFMKAAIEQGYFIGYPLLTSLSHTWLYLSGFKNPSIVYAFFYMSFVLSFLINLNKLKLGRIAVLILTLMVTVSPKLFDHSLMAYTNLPYTVYLVLSSIYLYFGIKNKDFGSYVLSAMFIGLSTWTRSAEPFWLSFLVVATGYSLYSKKWLWPIAYSVILFSLMIPWRIFLSFYQAGSADVARQIVQTGYDAFNHISLSTIETTLRFSFQNVVMPHLPFFLIFVAICIYKFIMKSKNWLYVFLILLNLGLTVFGTLVYIRYTPGAQDIPDSLTRMVMFFPPMVIILVAEIINENSHFFNKHK